MSSERVTALVKLSVFAGWITYAFYLFVFGPYAELRSAVGETDLPEERFGFTGADFFAFLEPLNTEAVGLYSRFQYFDIPNAALMGAAFAFLIWFLASKATTKSWPKALVMLPVFMALFDVIENLLILNAVGNLPLRFFGIAELAGTTSFFKFIFAVLNSVAFLILLVVVIVRLIRSRTSS